MTIGRLVCPIVFFVSGLGIGVLWSPFDTSSQKTPAGRSISEVLAENEKFLAELRETSGDTAVEFAKQFEDMTIRIKKGPIDAHASQDGRFVIRLSGSDETIASELIYPGDFGSVTELNRRYSFSHGDRTYSCDFNRNVEDTKVTFIRFDIADTNRGDVMTYMDDDADGRWDRFVDYTQKPPKSYVMKGLCWKERVKNIPKDTDEVPDPKDSKDTDEEKREENSNGSTK